MKLLLDTSIIIDYLRQKDKKTTILFELAQSNHSFFISIMSHAELYSGKSVWQDKKLTEALEKVCSGMQVLPLETHISREAGRIRAHYAIDLIDAIIAATASFHKLPLVTLNKKHFSTITEIHLFDF